MVPSPSVRMFNLLFSDCVCPRMLSFLPDRVPGHLKIRISERPHSYCDQPGALLRFPEYRSPTFRAKAEGHGSAAVCSTCISFGDALSDLDLLSRIECLNTESASRAALAFEAVAYGDADGVASNFYLELSATACGFAIRHVVYLSTERRPRQPASRGDARPWVTRSAGRRSELERFPVTRLHIRSVGRNSRIPCASALRSMRRWRRPSRIWSAPAPCADRP